MNRVRFLGNPLVGAFLEFFGRCMSSLEVSYVSGFQHLRPSDHHFHVTGVANALRAYAWPAIDTISPPPYPGLYSWATTSSFLGRARLALQTAISTGNEPATQDVAKKILKWGLTPNAVLSNIQQLNAATTHLGLTWHEYFHDVRALTSLATANTTLITPARIPYASSGTCKIHSLASDDGLIIFDSRVAAMLGECINEFVRRAGIAIPAELRILVELNHPGNNPCQRRPRPPALGANHRGFVRDHRWVECQVRASWLFEEVLRKNPGVFPGLPLPQRMHQLEAAAFMMGAYLEPGLFHGRTFNFARV